MKTIVSSRNPDLARDFERDLLRRKDLQLVTVDSARELVARARQGADLCFVDRALPDGDAEEIAASLRGDRRTAALPLVLLGGAGGRMAAAEAQALGFADVVGLPSAPGTIARLVGRLCGVALRDRDRWAVRVHVYGGDAGSLEAPTFLGVSVDLSEMGMLLRTVPPRRDAAAAQRFAVGDALALRFSLPGHDDALYLRAHVRRVDDAGFAPGQALALAFFDVESRERGALGAFVGDLVDGWPFRLTTAEAGGPARVSGGIDETTDLAPLAALGAGAEVSLAALHRFGPEGAQRWTELLRRRKAASAGPLRLHDAPVSFVRQAAVAPGLLDGAELVSLRAPYACAACDLDEDCLVEAAAIGRGRALPAFACRACGGPLAFDDLPDRYLAVLAGGEPAVAAPRRGPAA